ncbi:trigger factor [Candidatus Epulonipiscium fishelsonii]|uniref:Trigger factor n=1 Tax=Candidatus Epulonipiscium fishelsonii TaxID=77094 RepID=A0ACC8X8B9_9FIRM|nr:trigger factor [Epulopiscium sp. SCG-B11WGA-EpuloA1]ONI39733.1 trigger factor [Epulopiscium sp. SCG-B05WGA-EpuloA1]
MKTNVELLENSQVKLIVEVEEDIVSKAINQAYESMKKDFNVDGFRKGKVPRQMIEKIYGPEVFFNKAIDLIIDETLTAAIDENNIDIIARLRENDLVVLDMSKEKAKYEATIAVRPTITLGEYKNLEIEVEPLAVTEEEVDIYLNKEAEKNARSIIVEDRIIEPQDKAFIDFEGFVDGEAFEGGKGSNYGLVIGSKSFIPGFEDQLIGKKVGDEVEVSVTFPEEYHSEDLKGKPAIFKVKINEVEVTEIPTIDDEFAADVSEFDTLEEFKEDVRKTLLDQKEKSRTTELQGKAVEKAVQNATFELPPALVEENVDRSIQNFASRMEQQGLKIQQYLQFAGLDMEKFRENFRPEAIAHISSSFVLEKIAEVENLVVSDEEVEEHFIEMSKHYNMPVEQVKQAIGRNIPMLKEDLKLQKAADMLVSTAKIIEKN